MFDLGPAAAPARVRALGRAARDARCSPTWTGKPGARSRSDDPTVELARAAARYESGERAAALDDLRRISEMDGPPRGSRTRYSTIAASTPSARSTTRSGHYNTRHTLGVLGGDALAGNGLGIEPQNLVFSTEGYRKLKTSYKIARKTLNPVNL